VHAIRGYAQLLLTREDGAQGPEYLRTILHESDELLRVIDGILAYAAYDSHELRPAQVPFVLRTVVARAVEAVAARAKVKGLELSLHVEGDVPEAVIGDAVRLRQVIGNLLENAVKFTAQGGIEVRVGRATAARADRIAFSVRDSGIGIPEQGVARLFEPFVQGTSSATRQYGGTGLGLAIVQRLCAQMGGEIRARRLAEGGSEFEAVLPLPAAEGNSAHASDARSGAPVPDRELAARLPLEMLVVDDSRVVRELTVEQMRLLGYAPDAAPDARTAIQLAERKAYDLVLLDLQMPDMDGVTAAKALRSLMRPNLRAAKIVALSADVFAEKHALEDGSDFDAFIAKPVSLDALQRFLEELGSSRPSSSATVGQQPSEAVLEQRVIADLVQHRGRDGKPLLVRASQPLVEESESVLHELARLLAAGELAAVSALAHRLKGDCLLVGAWRAARAAGALSVAADDGLALRAGESLSALRPALSEARRAVLELRERITRTSGA
jgi:CheY-like chemotaxis protein